jgi:hypothetical protein
VRIPSTSLSPAIRGVPERARAEYRDRQEIFALVGLAVEVEPVVDGGDEEVVQVAA